MAVEFVNQFPTFDMKETSQSRHHDTKMNTLVFKSINLPDDSTPMAVSWIGFSSFQHTKRRPDPLCFPDFGPRKVISPLFWKYKLLHGAFLTCSGALVVTSQKMNPPWSHNNTRQRRNGITQDPVPLSPFKLIGPSQVVILAFECLTHKATEMLKRPCKYGYLPVTLLSQCQNRYIPPVPVECAVWTRRLRSLRDWFSISPATKN